MTNREKELLGVIGAKGAAEIEARQLIQEAVFLEERLAELKRLPFLLVNPKNRTQQKPTPAAKQYKELLQQYTNTIKLLAKLAGTIGDDGEESPLRVWLRERNSR